MFWEKELEEIERKTLAALQVKRLNNTLRQAVTAPHYRKQAVFSRAAANGLKTIDAIRELPFTTKEDLRSDYPWGFLAADKRDVVRLHSSSGTTGNPTVIYHNRHDLAAGRT
jgi:phenylacetate-CoA ligase